MKWNSIACILAATLVGAPALNAQSWIQSPLNGHWYARTTGFLPWTTAEALAVSYGGHLATIRNAAENAWLVGAFVPQPYPLAAWLGLNDQQVEGVWVWASGEPVVYANWFPGQPDNDLGVEDHVGLYSSGLWNDFSDGAAPAMVYGIIELVSDDCDGNSVPDKYELSLGTGPDCVLATGATPTSAQLPGTVSIAGSKLDLVTSVTIDGVPAQILSQSFAALTVQPQPGDPGFPQLTVTSAQASASVAAERWPSLGLTSTGLGGTVTVSIHNGTGGIAVVAYASGSFPAGAITLPPTWGSLQLDVTGPYVIVSSYGIGPTGLLSTVNPVPNNPALAGQTLYLQGWCQQGFFGTGVTHSFTNAAAVTF